MTESQIAQIPRVEFSVRNEFFLPDEPTVFDYETNSVNPWEPSFHATVLGAYNNRNRALLGEDNDSARKLTLALANLSHRPIGHNAVAFDSLCAKALTGVYLQSDDTMYLAHLINENGAHDLETLAVEHLGVTPWKGLVDAAGGFDAMSKEELNRYNALDLKHTYDLFHVLIKKAKDDGLLPVYEHVMRPGGAALAQATWRGIGFDEENRASVSRLLEERSDELRVEVLQGVGSDKFNPASPQQIAKLLFEDWKLKPVLYTPKNKPSTDAISLKTLALQLTRVGDSRGLLLSLMLRLREASKFRSTYANGWVRFRASDSRLHPHFFVANTVTGRSSCSEPAMQTLPRDPLLRSLVTAQPGGSLVSADYSAIELRLLAFLAPEKRMRDAFASGSDLHRLFAAKLTGRGVSEVTGTERTSAKIANFLLGYGGGAFTLQQSAIREYDLFWTLEESQRIYDAYHEQWPGLFASYYPRVAEELKRDGQVRSLTGRIRHLPDVLGFDRAKREAALRQAVNFKVQSLAGDLALTACHLAVEAGLPLVGFVHDSIMLDVPTPPDHPDTLLTAAKLSAIMSEEAPKYLIKYFGIDWEGMTFPVETKIGTCWS